MTLKPLGDRVLVERISEDEEQKVGNLYVPPTAQEKPQIGVILAVGNGKLGEDGKRIPFELKVGDKIFFGKYSGTEVKVDDKTLLIMREEDVFAVIEEKKA